MFIFNTTGQDVGNYSVVTTAENAPNYTLGINYTSFELINDEAGPVITLLQPLNGTTNVTFNVTFIYVKIIVQTLQNKDRFQ